VIARISLEYRKINNTIEQENANATYREDYKVLVLPWTEQLAGPGV
jgi:hypothetical protein